VDERRTACATARPAAFLIPPLVAGPALAGWLATPSPEPKNPGEPAITRTADDPGLAWGACPSCPRAVARPLHGDPAQPNVDILLLPAGTTAAPLAHLGRANMPSPASSTSLRGQETGVMKAGTYAYGPAKRPHQGRCASEVPCVLFVAFEQPLDAVPVASEPL
jgi:hypothetical protein